MTPNRFVPALLAALLACAEEPARESSTVDASSPGTGDDAGSLVVDAGADASVPSADGGSPDAAQDAGAPDATAGDAGAVDSGLPPDCPAPVTIDYTCSGFPASDACPAGLCLVGQCIAPVVDPLRWAACGDGACGRCEPPAQCPVDCAPPLVTTGHKGYDNGKTITVWLHGFSNQGKDALAQLTYGADNGCGELRNIATDFGIDRPCGSDAGHADDPTQLIALEYYGDNPAAWLSPQDIAEIQAYPYSGGPEGLQRYGLIAGKYIRHKLAQTGATHVNLACHSMGCLISRYVIENDIEHLASENRIVRWATSAGVIAGARLARLFDNPTVQATSGTIGLEVSDFILMNPDYVQEHAARWDHRLQEGNNPLFAGMLIHHVGGTDPKIAQAVGVRLLDSNNPGDEPNDGIMYTDDEYFASQAPAASHRTPAGVTIGATHSLVHVDHMAVPDSDAYRAVAAAGLFHRRKVIVTLKSVKLLKEREFSTAELLEQGTSPAEIAIESEVRYDLQARAGRTVLVQDDKVEARTSALFTQKGGTTTAPNITVFAAPVFDDMVSINVLVRLSEADWYPRRGVREISLAAAKELITYRADVPLVDGTVHAASANAEFDLEVRVHALY